MTSLPHIEAIVHALKARRCGKGFMARCPTHDDRSPSLSIRESEGRVLIHCHAGCSQQKVIGALQAHGLWPEREPRPWLPAPEYRAMVRRRRGAERLALLWRAGALAELERRKAEGLARSHQPGGGWTWWSDFIQAARRLYTLQSLPPTFLVERFTAELRASPDETLRLIRAAREDEQHARSLAAVMVAMLAAAERREASRAG